MKNFAKRIDQRVARIKLLRPIREREREREREIYGEMFVERVNKI